MDNDVLMPGSWYYEKPMVSASVAGGSVNPNTSQPVRYDVNALARNGAKPADEFQAALDKIPPIAWLGLPTIILLAVNRKKHPIIWWMFGVGGAFNATVQMIMKKRVF